MKRSRRNSPTIPAQEPTKPIDHTNTDRDKQKRRLVEQYYAITTANQLTNPDEGTIQVDRTTTDRGQQTVTRHRTKEM